jgi:hypothetical protein
MAEKRKSISKKLRFEVFKRDNFTCQYCGRMAPDVVLEIDHINPVSQGGDNELMNLVASCYECNRGKGAKKLTEKQELKAQQEQLKQLSIKREQMKMMLEWKQELMRLEDEQINAIDDIIYERTGHALSEHGMEKIKGIIQRFGFEEVFTSTEIALKQYYFGDANSLGYAINKIGGICYQRQKAKDDPMMPRKAYIAAILKKRCNYYQNQRVWAMLNGLATDEATAEIVASIAKQCRNWTAFWKNLNETFGSDW